MSATDITKTANLGTLFLMITGALILYGADGKTLLSQPVGSAYLIIWIVWWVMAFSMRSQRIISNNRRTSVVQMVFYIVIILATCLGAPWEYVHFSQPIPRDGLLAWLGIAISISSIILLTISLWVVGRSISIWKNHPMDAYLITNGPYQYIRHPGYLSVIIFVLGIALSLSSLIAGAAVMITIGYSLFRIYRDEEKLQNFYRESFLDYKTRTPWILLPGLY